MGFTKQMEEEYEIMKRLQEDRLHLRATEKCFAKCVTNEYFPNLSRWEKSCIQNCAEQWLQVAICSNKVFMTTDMGDLLA